MRFGQWEPMEYHEYITEVLQTTFWKRPMLPWEHSGMRFFEVEYFDGITEGGVGLTSPVRVCYEGKCYYYNIGIEAPEPTEEMIAKGSWQIYTWAD